MLGSKELKLVTSVLINMAIMYIILFIGCGAAIIADFKSSQINSDTLQTLRHLISIWKHQYLQTEDVSLRIIIIFNASVGLYGKFVKEIVLICVIPSLLSAIQGGVNIYKYSCS